MKAGPALLTWTVCFAGTLCAIPQEGSIAQTPATQRDDGPQITINGLLKFLANRATDEAAESLVIKLIQRYGIGFRPSASDFDAFRSASASEKLLSAIQAAKMPPVPAIREGTLAVRCAPVDCDVWINGSPRGETIYGRTILLSLPEGPASVTVTKRGYDVDRSAQEVQICKDELVQVNFDLKKSRALLTETGENMLKSMVAALGDPSAVLDQTFHSLRVLGTIYRNDSSNRLAIWSVDGWLTDFRLAQLEMAAETGRKRTLAVRAEPDLDHSIRQLLDGQLSAILPRLVSPGSSVLADDNAAGSLPAFRIHDGEQSYLVLLDAANRPSEIQVSSSPSQSPVRFLYSDYVEMGSAYVPRRTQVISANRDQGVELQIDVLRAEQPPPANKPSARSDKHSRAAKSDYK
jgi:Domain of unknown function (DUF4292)